MASVVQLLNVEMTATGKARLQTVFKGEESAWLYLARTAQ